MLDLLDLVFSLFTSPVEAIATLVLLGLIFVGIKWFASRSQSNTPLDTAPDVILRHRLKFVDEDLEHNRSATISPKQMKRLWNEFLMLLIASVILIVFFGFIFAAMFSDDRFGWGLDLFVIGLQSCMGLAFLLALGIAAFQLMGFIKDLRTKKAVALLSPLVFEEHEGEYMGFKFHTHQYKIIANDPRLPKPLPLHIGFMSEAVWYQVQKLRHQTAILYIAPNTSKLLSFELVATEPAISQENIC